VIFRIPQITHHSAVLFRTVRSAFYFPHSAFRNSAFYRYPPAIKAWFGVDNGNIILSTVINRISMFRICRLWSPADACSSSPYTECVQAAARHRLGYSLIEVDIVRYQFITRAAVYALSALTHQMLPLMLYVNISVHMHYIAAVRILNTNKHGRDAGPKKWGDRVE